MTKTEHDILQSLRELDGAVRSLKSSESKPDLMSHFRNIDTLTDQLSEEADPRLLHFLHKKSYEKARLWLEDRHGEIQQGRCLGD